MTSIRTVTLRREPLRQQGAVLAVSLILLLIMTMLAISGGQAVRLQERMASNLRDVDLALQGAEAGLRDAERQIESMTGWPTFCTSSTATGCTMFDIGVLRTTGTFDLRTQDQSWWNSSARDYRGSTSLGGLSRDPQFVVERAAQLCDTAEAPCPEADTLYYFRNTARAPGATGSAGVGGADVRIESTYVRRAP
jgi:type IV pilus assembly protein PilX